ncbi:FAD/NAD(P)-binding protein, partial [Candidatus Micrarchaeota archaeon]|nr:FAD/NAD(P)-binding protein [Candidatus Micrarchaeota archaeon]
KAVIRKVAVETPDVKTFSLEMEEKMRFKPGQFVELSILGIGEAPISISSCPRDELLELSVKRVGDVTNVLHELKLGDSVWVRGPYGNGWPEVEENDLVVGGGIGIAPLRPVVRRAGKISVYYGARTPEDLCFKKELKEWGKKMKVEVTVDSEGAGWNGSVGPVTALIEKAGRLDGKALICGPPIMIKFVADALKKKGVKEENVFVSLERVMKCGFGKCGRCMLGGKYVCTDGPVFKYSEMPRE